MLKFAPLTEESLREGLRTDPLTETELEELRKGFPEGTRISYNCGILSINPPVAITSTSGVLEALAEIQKVATDLDAVNQRIADGNAKVRL